MENPERVKSAENLIGYTRNFRLIRRDVRRPHAWRQGIRSRPEFFLIENVLILAYIYKITHIQAEIQSLKEVCARKGIYNGCSASLVMPNSYPRDGIFNPHLTTIKDSYSHIPCLVL